MRSVHSKSKSKSKPQSLPITATKARAQLVAMQQLLPIDDDLQKKQYKALVGIQHIPTEALAVAVSVLEKYVESFPTFDLKMMKEALDYETHMNEVAAQAQELAQRIAKSVIKHRSKAIEQTLALYAALKAVGRTDGTLLPSIERLGELVAVKRTKSKKSKKQDQQPGSTQPQPPADTPGNAAAKTPVAPSPAPAPAPAMTNGIAH